MEITIFLPLIFKKIIPISRRTIDWQGKRVIFARTDSRIGGIKPGKKDRSLTDSRSACFPTSREEAGKQAGIGCRLVAPEIFGNARLVIL